MGILAEYQYLQIRCHILLVPSDIFITSIFHRLNVEKLCV